MTYHKVFKFDGIYDVTKEYTVGDICVKDGSPYCYFPGQTWVSIEPTASDYEKKIKYPTNCKNCGAVLHDHICIYCGTNNKESI